MAEPSDFEPRLGKPGKDRGFRPHSQLSALAKSARWGKVNTHGRPKLAWGAVRHQGRGKGAAAMARYHAHPHRRRLFLKTSIAVVGPSGTKAFASHIAYIARDGTPEPGDPGRIFDRSEDEADPQAFNKRAVNDVRQFRWTVSPDDAGDLEDLTRFTRTLMKQVERDLRREVDWVAASHFNTAHPHIHIAVRGGAPQVDELIIARRYLTHGLRHRIEEALSAELGHRRTLDIAAERTRDAAQDRYTIVDGDLKRAELSGHIDLARPGRGNSRSSWSVRLSRLSHLRSRGLAEHVAGSVWRLKPGWADTLREMGCLSDLHHELAVALDGQLDRGKLQDISTAVPGARVTGRLCGVLADGAPTGSHIVILEGLDGRQWTGRLPARDARTLPEPGSVITLVPVPGTGRTPLRGPETGESPVSFRVRIDSWIPVEEQVHREAYTWLDQLDEDRLEGTAGFGAGVRAARLARQLWLTSRGLHTASREELQARELGNIAASQASRLGKNFRPDTAHGVFRGLYAGHVDTAQGRLAVIASDTRFTLTAWSQGTTPARGQQVVVDRGVAVFGRVLARTRGRTP